ncbi:hypothetical protein CKO31_21620 [Thiohalocapsa halophila]|uniref:DUF3322 and DUF2220 domain-containing protein n=1 Tax=Thiohalocapsa halophila TaxID=69359 RepID=A0ABS1CNC5_9GAMM|nr:DUF3322 and DUF2220 domain-containing protein [Thiohalocapsa halophila]MBK1633305.1 hypothetical protein [Thiohalocapsa halophila]
MAASGRLDPAAVTTLLRKRWRGGHRRWLDAAGSWPLTILLHPPTERETARDLAGVRDWIERWTAVDTDPARPGELIWTERQWPGLGRQRLPERLLLTGPEQVAVWVGEQARWLRAQERAAGLRRVMAAPTMAVDQDAVSASSEDRAPLDAAGRALGFGRHFDWLADAPAVDFERLLAVLRWLQEHPDSGLYVRQLPIPGIDTKWIGANRGRLVDLLGQQQRQAADTGDTAGTDLHALAGLRREPDLLRIRMLDPDLRAAVGGLGDITAPVEQIAALPLRPARAFLVENLQTGLAFDDLPGAVCCMARGYAVEAYAAIPWLRGRPCHYWGDLDTHGFAILSRLRQHLPDVHSLLMDEATLLRHRDLWQREEKPAAGPLAGLSPEEEAVVEGLLTDRWGERVRLEQERIDWEYARTQISGTLTSRAGSR